MQTYKFGTKDGIPYVQYIACDVVKQDCGDPTLKCTSVGDWLAGCMPIEGQFAEAKSCVKLHSPPFGSFDNCDMGLMCSNLGSVTADGSQPHCRALCHKNVDCKTPTTKCLVPFGVSSSNGRCSPTCTVFGTDCAAGLDCSLSLRDLDDSSFVPTCRGIGTGAFGSKCGVNTDCVARADCVDPKGTGSICVPQCDDAHPCVSGTCDNPPGYPAKTGRCL